MSDEDHDDFWTVMLRKRLRAHGWADGHRCMGQRAWRTPDGRIITEFDALTLAEKMPDEPDNAA